AKASPPSARCFSGRVSGTWCNMLSRYDGTQLRKVTRLRSMSCQNWDGDSRTSSLITTAVPPPINGSNICSMEASNDDEITDADRKSLPTSKSLASATILLARLACSTTTAFGLPVEPEV